MFKQNLCRTILPGVAGVTALFAQGQAPLILASEATISIDIRGKPVPKWSGGALVLLTNEDSASPSITSIDRQGRVTSTVNFTIPGAKLINAIDFARANDGAMALSGSASDVDGRSAFFIAWVSTDQHDVQVVRTGLYHPFRVAFAPDGTIWAAGYEQLNPVPSHAKGFSETLNSQASVFRHFDRSAKLIGAFVAQTEIAAPISLRSTSSVFGAQGKRIIWYAAQGGQYIELSSEGLVMSVVGLSLPTGGRENGFALTESGDTFISSVGGGKWAVSKLDRTHKLWTRIAGGAGAAIQLYGADSNTLVGWTHGGQLAFYNISN